MSPSFSLTLYALFFQEFFIQYILIGIGSLNLFDLTNPTSLIVGSQLGKCLTQRNVSQTTLEHVLHVCLASGHVSSHVARHGGLRSVMSLLSDFYKSGKDTSKVIYNIILGKALYFRT